MRIQPARRLKGRLQLPGDKSISHRAAILAAIADGASIIKNFSTSADCASTLSCLERLGISIERNGNELRIEGAGPAGFKSARAARLDCGNSGTTMRLLAGVLAGQNFTSSLTGDASLRSRPMKRIIEPLELMGAGIESEMNRAPLRITGLKPLRAITYEMPVASAQVKSCILLAGINAEGTTTVIERQGQTRDHTERMLNWCGVEVIKKTMTDYGAHAESLTIKGPAELRTNGGTIPGDLSSAAFFIAAAALLPGSQLEIENVGLNLTRKQLLSTLTSLGADLNVNQVLDPFFEDFNEPFGDLRVHGGAGLAPFEDGRSNNLSGALIPQLIDELPMLAVLGTQVIGGLTIRDAAELRVKETDRIAAVVKNLREMGAEVEEYEDGLSVGGPQRLRGARVESFGDHRIAMAFAIAALIAEGETEIVGAECVAVSFPEFFRLLESVIER